MNTFDRDLADAKPFEREACTRIEKLNNVKCIATQDGKNKNIMKHDFTTSDNIKYEVKHDIASTKWGNAFIEFKNKYNVLTGISITTADYYIIISDYNDNQDIFYLVEVAFLKSANVCNKRIGRTPNGSCGYLVPISELKENSVILL